jgi:hypothetical protein
LNDDQLIANEGLTDLQAEVIDALTMRTKEHGDFSLSFTGIRRILKMPHQQRLTNALDDLIETGFIRKGEEGGYSLTHDFLDRSYIPKKRINSSPKQTIVIEGQFSRSIPVPRILMSLVGRYFGPFRYVGSGMRGNQAVIEWISINRDAQILLKLEKASLKLTCYGKVSNSDLNKIKTMIGSSIIQENILIRFNDTQSIKELNN